MSEGNGAHLCSLLQIGVWVANKSDQAAELQCAVAKEGLGGSSVWEVLPMPCAPLPASQGWLCFSCRMLVTLIKYKPQISQEQLTSVTAAFTAMRERCCREENRQACFGQEVACLFSPTLSESKRRV